MSKKDKTAVSSSTKQPSKRKGTMFYLPPDVATDLDRWINDQEVKPGKTALFTAMVKKFLKEKGYLSHPD